MFENLPNNILVIPRLAGSVGVYKYFTISSNVKSSIFFPNFVLEFFWIFILNLLKLSAITFILKKLGKTSFSLENRLWKSENSRGHSLARTIAHWAISCESLLSFKDSGRFHGYHVGSYGDGGWWWISGRPLDFPIRRVVFRPRPVLTFQCRKMRLKDVVFVVFDFTNGWMFIIIFTVNVFEFLN